MLCTIASLTSATWSLKISLFRELLQAKWLFVWRKILFFFLFYLPAFIGKKILDVKKACIKIVFQTPNVGLFLNAKPNPIAVLHREELESRQFAFN